MEKVRDMDQKLGSEEIFSPHSAPPSVIIGNLGFLKTFEDNFNTKWSKV
jgi:hypothetical protein